MKKRLIVYLAGLPIGVVAGLVANYAIGKPLSAVWIWNCGNLVGLLALAWAEHQGRVPSIDEATRPITLFPRDPG
jgi:hypothetical protein